MRVVLVLAFVLSVSTAPAFAALSSVVVVSGLSAPVAVVQDPTQPNVQLVVEQGGRIRVVRNGQLEAVDFLNLTPLVVSGGERGLLGLAFAPDYATSGRFFVNYTRQPDGHTVVARYRRSASDPLRADPASGFALRWPSGSDFIVQPFANHNGGDLQFGSDGFLYIPLGDGGSGNDPDHRAQNPAELLGKILRIDVNVSDADFEGYDVPASNPFAGQTGVLGEIWAFGLRNPFRVSVDAIGRGGTGALLVSDVGQNAWEEVNYEPFGAGGRNYGWRNREGAHDNVLSLSPAFLPLTDPFVEYSHAEGNVITGGVVYRGTGLGVAYFGRYFYADFGAGRIWSVGIVVDAATREGRAGQIIEHTAALGGAAVGNVSAFGIDANCEILFLNYSGGEVRRIVDPSGPAAGCPTSPDPYLNSGGGVFVDGTWVTRDHPAAAGAGLAGVPDGGCTTQQPVAGWVCVAGGWVPPDHPVAGGSSDGGSTTSPPPSGDTSSCATPPPATGWVCVNGGWVPPDHPLATGPSGGSTSTPPPPPTSTGCTTPQPATDWVPPDHPLAATAPPPDNSGGSTPPAESAGCTTPDPFAAIPGLFGVCINGGWVPSTHQLVTGG